MKMRFHDTQRKEPSSAAPLLFCNIKPGLGRIVCSGISEKMDLFLTLPLNPTGAFARQSSILEATVKLMAVVEIAVVQQGLDRDLLMAVAVLYYRLHFKTIDSGYSKIVTNLMYGPSVAAAYNIHLKSLVLVASNGKAKYEIVEEDVIMLGHILTARGNTVNLAFPESASLKLFDRMIQEVDEMNAALVSAEDAVFIDPNHFNRLLYRSQERK